MSPESAVKELPGSFSRSFIAGVSAPRAARRALQGLSGHVDEGLLERGRIVVTELVTNSVRHAGLAPEQQIELRVWPGRELLRVEVSDDGDGFDPVAMRPHPDQSAGGWGLWIVAQLTDRWGVDVSHSTRLVRVRNPCRPAAPRHALTPDPERQSVGTFPGRSQRRHRRALSHGAGICPRGGSDAAAGTPKSASDGTRTRELRRDRRYCCSSATPVSASSPSAGPRLSAPANAPPKFRAVAHAYLEWLERVRGAKPATPRNHRYPLAEPGAAHRRGRERTAA